MSGCTHHFHLCTTSKNYNKDTKEFTYDINISVSINNYECTQNIDKKEEIDKLNKLSSTQIKENIQELINIQNQNNYDFLGIKNYVQKHSKQNEINNIKINVNTQINSIGEMRR